jgi:hypothetical protein
MQHWKPPAGLASVQSEMAQACIALNTSTTTTTCAAWHIKLHSYSNDPRDSRCDSKGRAMVGNGAKSCTGTQHLGTVGATGRSPRVLAGQLVQHNQSAGAQACCAKKGRHNTKPEHTNTLTSEQTMESGAMKGARAPHMLLCAGIGRPGTGCRRRWHSGRAAPETPSGCSPKSRCHHHHHHHHHHDDRACDGRASQIPPPLAIMWAP